MSKRSVLALLLVFIAFALPAMAQENEPTENCSAEAIADLLTELRARADAAEAAADPVAAVAELETVGKSVATMQAECSGLSFGGDADSVIGPVTFPEGVYRSVATTDEFITVQFAVLEGDCGSGARMSAGSLFIASRGDAAEGAEAIFASAGCSALLEVTNVGSDWTLTFEKVG